MKSGYEPFQSKRNTVFLHRGVVFKCVKSPEAARREAEFLRWLRRRGAAVPRVKHCVGRVLTLEHIAGVTLADYLCGEQVTLSGKTAAQAVVDWFGGFYRAVEHDRTGEIRGDVNGRNFIVSDRVWGVDFEERCFGMREQDAGRLMAFVCTYTVPQRDRLFEFSHDLFREFASRLKLDTASMQKAKEEELSAMVLRRKGASKALFGTLE